MALATEQSRCSESLGFLPQVSPWGWGQPAPPSRGPLPPPGGGGFLPDAAGVSGLICGHRIRLLGVFLERLLRPREPSAARVVHSHPGWGCSQGLSRGEWRDLRKSSLVAFFPYREIPELCDTKKKERGADTDDDGKEGESRWVRFPRWKTGGTQLFALCVSGLKPGSSGEGPLVSQRPPQEFWTQAAEHRDSLQGGCVAGGGGQRSLRPSSPGANSGHKLCVGQRSDFQRCHKGILKRNWYRERCRACLSASSPPAVALHPQGLGLGNSVPAECMQGRGDIIQQPLPQDAGQPGRSDEPLGRALCRERQELTRQWDT